MDIRFEREARTPHSESWVVEDAEHSLGRVDEEEEGDEDEESDGDR